MNEITKMFGEQPVRIIEKDNEPMFCLADVCKVLELDQVSRVKDRLNPDGVTISKVIDNMGRTQEATFISEQNLYKVIFQSRKPEAEKFSDWVTGEVLPSIRKEGQYSMRNDVMEQHHDGMYISMRSLLDAIDEDCELDSPSYKACIHMLLHAAIFSGQMKTDFPKDLMRLILEALDRGQLVIPGKVRKIDPAAEGKACAIESEKEQTASAPAKEAEHKNPFHIPGLDLPRTSIIREAQIIVKMTPTLSLIRRIAAETGKHLTGVPIPTFDYDFPLKLHSKTSLINIDELAERMKLPPETLEEDVRRYYSDLPNAFCLMTPDFNVEIAPQLLKYDLKFENRYTLINHPGAILLAYLHDRYIEVPPSICGSDMTLRKQALEIMIQKGKIVKKRPTEFRNKSLFELDQMLEPFGGYAKILDDNWKKTM